MHKLFLCPPPPGVCHTKPQPACNPPQPPPCTNACPSGIGPARGALIRTPPPPAPSVSPPPPPRTRYGKHHIPSVPQGRPAPWQALTRRQAHISRGRGGVWEPKVCAPKLAQQESPQFRCLPRWSLWSFGGGGGVWGSAVLPYACPADPGRGGTPDTRQRRSGWSPAGRGAG